MYKIDVSKLVEKIWKEDVIEKLMQDKAVELLKEKAVNEKKLKAYQDSILHEYFIISKHEEEPLKMVNEAVAYTTEIETLTSETDSLEDLLKSSTIELDEKNLLNIEKSDEKTLQAAKLLLIEEINSLPIENESLKLRNKNERSVTDLGRENEELKVKVKELENENRDTLNYQMQILEGMKEMKVKNYKLKEKKRELKVELEEQNKKVKKLLATNKILRKKSKHLTEVDLEDIRRERPKCKPSVDLSDVSEDEKEFDVHVDRREYDTIYKRYRYDDDRNYKMSNHVEERSLHNSPVNRSRTNSPRIVEERTLNFDELNLPNIEHKYQSDSNELKPKHSSAKITIIPVNFPALSETMNRQGSSLL